MTGLPFAAPGPLRRALTRQRAEGGGSGPRIPAQRRPLRVTVMAEPGRSPVWVEDESGIRNVDPSEIGIPAALAADLTAWGADQVSASDDEAYFARGYALAREAAACIGPAADVRFFDAQDESLRRI